MKNIRIFFSVFLFLVCVGNSPASAREKQVTVPEIGTVNESTAYIFKIMQARQKRALGQVGTKTEEPALKMQEAIVVSRQAETPAQKTVVAAPGKTEVASVVVPYHSVPSREKPDHSFKHSFEEVSAYAGLWRSPASSGGWTQTEWTHWMTRLEDAENFGIGATLKTDDGSSKAGYHWGYVAPGANFDYYRAFTPVDDILVRARMFYRFGQISNGWMPGGYLQYSHAYSSQNRLILSADGQYFPNDSYLGLALLGEHRFNPDYKIKVGGVMGVNFLENETVIGLGPEVVLNLHNRFEIGLNMSFATGGPFMGAFVGYNLNTDLRERDAKRREKSVELKKAGQVTSATEVVVEKSSDGSYKTIAGEVVFSQKTLDQE